MHLPPIVATLLYLSLIVYLFRRDFRQKPNVTPALWLPISWVFISGSRFISQWLDMLGINLGGASLEEGSPLDAVYFLIAILLGLRVLTRRRVQLSEFVRHNRWIAIFLLYCLVACAWSDFPLVAIKRWVKLIGSPIMVLVILTEPDPREAMVRLFKRCAYVIVPISILFIKYYPQWGRNFDPWSGEGANSGITTDKNTLGVDCFLLGFFFYWQLLNVWQQEKSKARRNELLFCTGFLVAIFWLFHEAHSSTSLVSVLLAMTIATLFGFKFVRKEAINLYLIVIIVIGLIAEFGFNISGAIIAMLGKNPTLTGRTDIWHILLNWDVNPIIGTGYESFYLGERREKLWAIFPMLFLNSSHNGYLETYLNLGFIGLFITLAMLMSAYAKARRELFHDFSFGRFRMAYLIAFIIYNWTEVAFRTHCVPFFGFFLVAIDYPWHASVKAWNPLVAKPASTVQDYEF